MLPAAKVLLVTVLLGGGTVGTYALAGGKFGTGSGGNGNAETTAQVSTPESTTPSTDGQQQTRVEGAAPAAPREGETVEERAQGEGSSVTLAGADGGKDAGSADASPSSRAETEVKGPEKALEATDSANSDKGRPEVREEVTSAEGKQQTDPKVDVAPSGDVQAREGSGTPGVGEVDAEGGSNVPGTVENTDSNSQTGNQGVVAERREDQVAANLPEPNAGQDGQSDAGTQDKGNTDGGNQADLTVTTDSNTNAGRSSPEGQVQA